MHDEWTLWNTACERVNELVGPLAKVTGRNFHRIEAAEKWLRQNLLGVPAAMILGRGQCLQEEDDRGKRLDKPKLRRAELVAAYRAAAAHPVHTLIVPDIELPSDLLERGVFGERLVSDEFGDVILRSWCPGFVRCDPRFRARVWAPDPVSPATPATPAAPDPREDLFSDARPWSPFAHLLAMVRYHREVIIS
jgi:hypothetical protein